MEDTKNTKDTKDTNTVDLPLIHTSRLENLEGMVLGFSSARKGVDIQLLLELGPEDVALDECTERASLGCLRLRDRAILTMSDSDGSGFRGAVDTSYHKDTSSVKMDLRDRRKTRGYIYDDRQLVGAHLTLATDDPALVKTLIEGFNGLIYRWSISRLAPPS